MKFETDFDSSLALLEAASWDPELTWPDPGGYIEMLPPVGGYIDPMFPPEPLGVTVTLTIPGLAGEPGVLLAAVEF